MINRYLQQIFALSLLLASTVITAADISWETDEETEDKSAVEVDEYSPYILIVKLPSARQLMFKIPYSRLEQVRGMLINFANMPDRGRNYVKAKLFSLTDHVAGPNIEFSVYLLDDLIQGLTALSFSDT